MEVKFQKPIEKKVGRRKSEIVSGKPFANSLSYANKCGVCHLDHSSGLTNLKVNL